ncbi:hypothetical protein FQN54_009537 [Arachnomyces sp. PD_36]|nr:hypothetical protein FQN54_009537 [Arachnomyces sp. PD_36]
MLAKRTITPALSFWNPTPDATPQSSPIASDSDTDDGDDDDISMNSSQASSRPVSVSLPGGHHPPRPTLDEVLANTATPPYTLSAFMAYLSQNHCLETLEFTLDANRYRDTYNTACRKLRESPLVSESPENDHLRMLWERLMSAYVVPGAVREVNLSSQVRDALLSYHYSSVPPRPQTLESAVKRIHDLMDESIFIPFLNTFSSSTSLQHSQSTSPYDEVEESMAMSNSSIEDSSTARHPSRRRRASPQQSRADFSSYRQQALGYSNRNANVAAPTNKASHRVSGHGSMVSGDSGSTSLTDDSGSGLSSPDMGEPMTPPTTPPSTDMYPPQGGMGQGQHSPRPRSDNAWRKMSMKLGWKKKSGGGSATASQTSSSSRDSRHPSIEDD